MYCLQCGQLDIYNKLAYRIAIKMANGIVLNEGDGGEGHRISQQLCCLLSQCI